ncbi:MAG: hypothetical protein GYA51_14705 [Candidatus Methanofastidiosa archaeon]|nr:hypothetical protein [Candidatus Methanofastidiosa archaeon]
MASIENLISQYWKIIFSVLIVLFIALIFLVRTVSKKKEKKPVILDTNKERKSVLAEQKTVEPEIKEEVKTQTYDIPLKHLGDTGSEIQKTTERKKINTWADFIIEIDNLAHSLEDAKAHEYFKMSQMYRDLTRFYFDNIQNPNIGKTDMDDAWKKLEASYSKIQKLLESI